MHLTFVFFKCEIIIGMSEFDVLNKHRNKQNTYKQKIALFMTNTYREHTWDDGIVRLTMFQPTYIMDN